MVLYAIVKFKKPEFDVLSIAEMVRRCFHIQISQSKGSQEEIYNVGHERQAHNAFYILVDLIQQE